MPGGSQQTGTQTQTQLPPQYMYPYIGTANDQAAAILKQGGGQYYPGETVAGFSAPQQQAMQRTFNLGIGKTGAGGLNAADAFDQTLLNGGGTNPYLDATFTHAAQMTQPELQSEFASAGRDLSGALPQRSEEINNLATSIYGGAYQNNIQNALQAGNQAQDIYRTRLQGAGAAQGVGQQVQDQAQKLIDANKAKYDFYQNKPQQNLQDFLKSIWAGQAGSSTNSPIYTNPTQNALGIASIIASFFA